MSGQPTPTNGATSVGARPTWEQLAREARERLVPLGDAAAREARWMVEEASGADGGRASGPAPLRAADRLRSMVGRRLAGEPLQYVLGSWSFRTLDLMVDRRVLIPRPETEFVVETSLQELDRRKAAAVAVDLGTGSGAIALSLAAERKGIEIWATDASHDALGVASANLAGLGGSGATRVHLVAGDWWDALPGHLAGRVDLLVSNPPYISIAERADLDQQVREWEPQDALIAGPTGLEAVEVILAGVHEWVASGGAVVLEIAPHQAEAAARRATAFGLTSVEVRPDLAGRPRALVATRP